MSAPIQDPEPAQAPIGRQKRWWRDPFTMFLAIGLALFALDRVRPPITDREIHIDEAAVERLQALWTAQAGRLPTLPELEGLVEDAVREEVLYREAIRLGLDRDDTIVRRRLAQKMGFLLDDTARTAEPSEADLRAYHQEHSERYREPERWTFRHVYFSVDRRGLDGATGAAEALREELMLEAGSWRASGDPFMLQREYGARSRRELMELFGSAFVDQLESVPETQRNSDQWRGPLRSALGIHLVQIQSWEPAAHRSYEQVATEVLEDWTRDRRREANEAAYQRILKQYELEVAALPEDLPGDVSRDNGTDNGTGGTTE